MTELADLADVPITLSLAGEPTPVAKLRPSDIALASQHLLEMRLRATHKAIPVNDIMRGLHGDTLANVACKVVMLTDLLDDPEGRIALSYYALRRGGSQLTMDQVRQKLDHQESQEFFWTLAELSGFLRKPKDMPSDPTETLATTKSESG